jgi:hypothetical protein
MATGPCQAGFAETHYYIYLGGRVLYQILVIFSSGNDPGPITREGINVIHG